MVARHAHAAVAAERRAQDGGPLTPQMLALAEAHRAVLDGVLLRAWGGPAARDEAQAYWRQGRRALVALVALEPCSKAMEGVMGNGAPATNRGQGVARSAGRRGYFTAPATAPVAATQTAAPKAQASAKTATKASATPKAARPATVKAPGSTPPPSVPKSSTPNAAKPPKPEKASAAALAYHRGTRPEGSHLESLGNGQYRLSMPVNGVMQSRVVTGAELNAAFKAARGTLRQGARSTLRAEGKAGRKAAGLEHLGRHNKTAGQVIHHDTHDLWRTFRQSHDILRKVKEHFL